MLLTLFSAFKVPDLRKRLLFVLLMFGVFIFGLYISVPGVDQKKMEDLFKHGGLLGMLDVFTGGALSRFSIFAMGITPYINASIIMSLLTVVVPELERLRKHEGEEGRKKISQYTRYLTIVLSLMQATGMTFWLRSIGVMGPLEALQMVRIILTLTAGTAFLMWVGEQITDKGIGNGVSLVIFCGIVARMPSDLARTFELYKEGAIGLDNLLLLGIVIILVTAGVLYVYQGERRITVSYTKRIIGRKMYSGGSTFLPIKVNQAGVIPIIFAMSILLFPPTIAQFVPLPQLREWVNAFVNNTPIYNSIYAILVIFFAFFYTAVTFNPVEVSDNLKKYGGFIPGVRPGKPTAEYLDKIITRTTTIGAIFLAAVAVIPEVIMRLTGVETFYFGGTMLLIVVGVALDTISQIESQLMMRQYEGFIK